MKTVADRYGVPIVADAAESLGSWLNGQACGAIGLLNIVSFNINKIITTFGGGALFTDDLTLLTKASSIANQGRTTEPPYTQSMTGGNYRLSPLNAGYGLEQIAVLTERVDARRAIFSQYHQALAHWLGVSFQPELPGAVSNRWLTALTVDSQQLGITRDTMAQLLRLEGIETRPVFTPLHRLPPFEGCSFYGNSLADDLGQTGLCLPSSSSLSEEDTKRVIQAFTRHCGTLQPKRAVISS